MMKTVLATLACLLLATEAASAQTYPVTKPPGGLDSTTVIPKVYADGSDGTLAQIGQEADGSVQQTSVGAASGVAPLDTNKMMSAPVSGAVSSGYIAALRNAKLSEITPNYANLWADMSQMPNIAIGTSSPLYTAYINSKNGDTIDVSSTAFPYPNGATFPHEKNKSVLFNFHGQVAYGPNGAGSAPGTTLTDHSIMHGFWSGAEQYSKSISLVHNADGSVIDGAVADDNYDYNPLINIKYNVDDRYAPASWGGRNDVPGLTVESVEGVDSKNSSVPIIASTDSAGTGGYFSNTVAIKTYNTIRGNNSTWGIDTRITDISGKQPMNDDLSGAGYNVTAYEGDVQVNGQDNPNIEFNPFGYRMFQHLGAGFAGTNEASYGENVCAYHVGDIVSMPEYNIDGTPVLDPWGHQLNGIFHVTALTSTCGNNTGKTGSVAATSWVRGAGAPAMWKLNSDNIYVYTKSSLSSITSGNVIFAWGEDENATIGNGVRVIGSDNTSDLQNGKPQVQLGSMFYGSGYVLGAGMDLSGIHCGINIENLVLGKQATIPWTKCQAIRVPSDMGIDWTAKTASVSLSPSDAKASMNLHTTVYSSTDKALDYIVSGNTVFSIDDSGNLKTPSFSDVLPSSASYRRDYTLGFSEAYGQARAYSNGWKWMDAANVRTTSFPYSGQYNITAINANVADGYTVVPISATSSRVSLGTPLQMEKMTKAAILALTSPSEGDSVYDTDDHAEVTYRCPTTSTCRWFPVQYGAALSN